jgi:hypothetical protein
MELDDADRPWKLLSFTVDLVIVGFESHCAGIAVVLMTSLHRALGTVDMVRFVVCRDELGSSALVWGSANSKRRGLGSTSTKKLLP